MTTVTKLPANTEIQSQMLDYVVRIYDANNEIVEVWRYEGYSGNSMWDEERHFYKLYPKHKGYRIDW
jgi:hypothetical protein